MSRDILLTEPFDRPFIGAGSRGGGAGRNPRTRHAPRPAPPARQGPAAAKLAGIPDRVITRAREILKELESGAPETAKPAAGPVSDQVSMLDMQSDELRRALEAVTVETLTPIEAMNVLYQLKQLL